jgi:hypothetical protein
VVFLNSSGFPLLEIHTDFPLKFIPIQVGRFFFYSKALFCTVDVKLPFLGSLMVDFGMFNVREMGVIRFYI